MPDTQKTDLTKKEIVAFIGSLIALVTTMLGWYDSKSKAELATQKAVGEQIRSDSSYEEIAKRINLFQTYIQERSEADRVTRMELINLSTRLTACESRTTRPAVARFPRNTESGDRPVAATLPPPAPSHSSALENIMSGSGDTETAANALFQKLMEQRPPVDPEKLEQALQKVKQ